MKYLDDFRDPTAARALTQSIAKLCGGLNRDKKIKIMEVCGSHTMAIARYGIRSVLPDQIELISGPGCPVCVTAPGYIDAAIELARSGKIVATFGDMIKTPGSDSSLADVRTDGAQVEVCYSPLAAIEIAERKPDREVVFLAIGFETTVAPVVSLIEIARSRNIDNISLLTSFKVVPPALEALCIDPELEIDAFLCPAHVSAIIGSNAYLPIAREHGLPCVVAGFEPLDILFGIEGILKQLRAGCAQVENQYNRIVKPDGNPRAQAVIAKHLQPAAADWRGLGRIPASGLDLRDEYADYDSARKYGIDIGPGREPAGCLCGEVVKGKCRPQECQLFGDPCNPDTPVGPCMVSQEGSCAAAYKY